MLNLAKSMNKVIGDFKAYSDKDTFTTCFLLRCMLNNKVVVATSKSN